MFVFYHCNRPHDFYIDVVRVGLEGGGDGGDVCLLWAVENAFHWMNWEIFYWWADDIHNMNVRSRVADSECARMHAFKWWWRSIFSAYDQVLFRITMHEFALLLGGREKCCCKQSQSAAVHAPIKVLHIKTIYPEMGFLRTLTQYVECAVQFNSINKLALDDKRSGYFLYFAIHLSMYTIRTQHHNIHIFIYFFCFVNFVVHGKLTL